MILGNISFQANDKADVFLMTQVRYDGVESSDEVMVHVEDTQFDSDKAWVTGYVPRIKPIHIEGDTAIIHAWFKGESYADPFVITVYVECEMAEELEEVVADAQIQQEESGKRDLEPREIIL